MTRWPPRPSLSSAFYKGHGLGNDYLVFEAGKDWHATPENVRRVCDRHRGMGSDGIVAVVDGGVLEDAASAREAEKGRDPGETGGAMEEAGAAWRPGDPATAHVRLRMFNPDGGEFERSGNGLRVLASWLLRRTPGLQEIVAEVAGSPVRMVVHGREGAAHDVSLRMGRARIGADAVGLAPEALDAGGAMTGPDGEVLDIVAVSVGNPHVVVFCRDDAEFTEGRLASVGPFLAEHPAIEHGTNVQLALHDGEGHARALVWERGVGRTSASGTSACAVAVALASRGAVEPGEVEVRMPGGALRVTVSAELDVVLRGPVEEVAEGRLSARLVEEMERE